MNFKERIAVGETMDAKQLEAEARGLLADPRFNAVLGMIKRQREQYVTGGSQQAMAADAGKMAHCNGSIYALDTLLQTFDGLGAVPKRRGERPPAQSEQ